ncbi:hypothetical protein [Actinomadura rudentiformis]|uniref:Uncharacterized protein n=1 Tax=Actinomadura rudentiformis TaxID=359158 RepID=A0A6H9YT21_9ACTN|nr:hypothetical protein [Actinomadura rudentiformis]KAB2347310.1 hypothetical protein F8566_20065 [Actinomadura rudentiformis]
MRRKICVHVEHYRPNDETDYYDLPDNWDDKTPEERRAELDEMARDALFEAAGSSAFVVEVDENGREIRVLNEDES